jgi:HD superfamily phosphohydrolase
LGDELPAPGNKPIEIPMLGYCSFGAVVRAKDRVELSRAVKILDPSRALTATPRPDEGQYYTGGQTASLADAEAISTRFEQEIRHTNARPFKNILPVIDYGRLRDADERGVFYYVQPFISGNELDRFLEQRVPQEDRLSRTERTQCHDLLLSLIDDLLAAIEELEEAQVIHMDIKPANTMVLAAPDISDSFKSIRRERGADRLFLIDLGAARSASLPAKSVPLIMTPYFFPMHLLDELDYESGKVAHSKLMRFGSKIDLYSAGRMLESFFLNRLHRPRSINPTPELQEKEPQKERVFRALLEDDFEVMEGIIDRLLDTGEGAFPTAADARLAFQTLSRRTSHSVFASRILTDQAPGIRIRVGRALVRIAPPFVEIVDHPVFQRLRRLQQLALLSEVFPDATHTRFAHVLHTFHIAKRFVRGLYHDAQFRKIFTQRDVDHVLAAALLHDIGQYPFSHTIEDLRKLGDICQIPTLQTIRYDQELAAEYIDLSEPTRPSIRSILEDHGFAVESIVYLFQKTQKRTSSDALSIGRDIISGVIDVDRVSYLLGDSDRSGMSFGAAMDVDGLVEALCIKPRGNVEGASLAVEQGGVSSVDAMLTAVYWMYGNVYWRHTNRGFMAAVKFAMQTLLESGTLTFDQYKEYVYGRSDWDALTYLYENLNRVATDGQTHPYNPLETLVMHRRFGHHRVFSLGADTESNSILYSRIIEKVSPFLIEELTSLIIGRLPAACKIQPGEILVDIPLKKRLRRSHSSRKEARETSDTAADAGSRPSMWVRMRNRGARAEWQDLLECSPLAALLGRIEDHSGRKIRVFASRELMNRIPGYDEATLGRHVREEMRRLVGL